jgi:Ca-activated chloride channel family protein
VTALRFADPWWLAALAVPALLLWRSLRRRGLPAALFSSVALASGLPNTWAQRIRRLLPWSRALTSALVVVGLARPQLGREEFRLRTDGVAIQMVIDRSASMREVDFAIDRAPVDRLTAVKHVFEDFVSGTAELRGRPNDQIGLIAFGGFVDVLCPLTLDHDALLHILRDVKIPEPIVDGRGRIADRTLYEEEISTAIGDAIAVAVDRLKDSPAKSKVIVLLSDGENTAGVLSPKEAAALAKEAGVKIHAIGVGNTGYSVGSAADLFGRMRPQTFRLDEATLKEIAADTKGQYFNAKDVSALREVYREIDALEKTEAPGRVFSQFKEMYPVLIWPAVLLALLDVGLTSTRLRSVIG